MAEVFIDPDMVLTWFLAQLGVSNLLIGLVSPIRWGGWFLPQLFISGYLQRQPRKLPFYRAMVAARSVALLLLVGVVILVPPHSGWLAGLFFLNLCIYALFSGLGGIPFMDTVGKLISPTRRGAFFGQRMFWGGILALGSSALVGYLIGEPDGLRFPMNFGAIFGLGFFWLTVAMGAWCFVEEPADAVDSRVVRWTEQLARGTQLLRSDRSYRTFVLARLAVMLAGVATPFYIVFARNKLHIPAQLVGVYLTVRTIASIASNLVWGRISDRLGNRRLIQLTNAIGLLVPAIALGIGAIVATRPDAIDWLGYVFALVFVAAGASGTGSAMGNINYLFDIAPPQERPLYLGFTNTLFGIGIFTSALGGLIVDWSGFTLLLGVSAVCYGLALALSFLMIEPRRKRELSA